MIQTQAFYEKKVLVGQFQSPTNLDKAYHLGNIISEYLTRGLRGHKKFQLISISEQVMWLMENSGIFSRFLEGRIIAIKRKEITEGKGGEAIAEKEIMVITWVRQMVFVWDLLQAHVVGSGLNDPYTASDLGDVYAKNGVIQIPQTW